MEARLLLESQLKSLSLKFRLFGRAEVRELRRILHSGEQILHCIFGYYQGGSGILVATNKRILLVDKRPFFLNLESISYEKIRDVAFNLKFLQATLHLQSGMHKLTFRSVSDARLRKLKEYVESRMRSISQIEQEIVNEVATKTQSYINPVWQSRHNKLRTRKYPTKFYPTATSQAR
ncbi:MAG: hypothetical protein ACI9T8_000124 [Candidatus Saccharimonadales bacterium]|jgi:hypothetical protein